MQISKIARVCQSDDVYFSYSEIPLVCSNGPSENYNLITDAYVAKPGYDLANEMGTECVFRLFSTIKARTGIGVDESVLFAVFSKGGETSETARQRQPASALCVYSMQRIEAVFMENIVACNRGSTFKVSALVLFSKSTFNIPGPRVVRAQHRLLAHKLQGERHAAHVS